MNKRLKGWWDEYHYLMTIGSYNPLWFLVQYGHEKGERIYKKKNNKQWQRKK